MTGLVSGMDTESMVQELVKASSTKVDNVKKEKQLLEWKKEAWQDLNTKIYDFFKNEVSAFKTNGTYKGKKATASDGTKVSVTAKSGASNGTHSVSVKQLASSAYLTGENIKASGKTFTNADGETMNASDISKGTKLADLGIAVGTTFSIKGKDFVVDDSTTISDFTAGLSKMGVTASFDETQGRIYVNATGTGAENDFNITASDENALEVLGLGSGATKIDAKDAIIEYNGVEYKGSTNTFDLNGLSITAKAVTGTYDATTGAFTNDSPISIEVAADNDSAYDTIKNFVKKYNALIDEMNELYDEQKSDYEPLTEEEKAQLSETEVEKWEKKAKEGILRRDSTINSLLSSMRSILNTAVTVTNDDGSTSSYTLSSLGIVTGDYSEKGKLHILGDEDDTAYASETNKLKEFLEQQPDTAAKILAGTSDSPGIGLKLYNSLSDSMSYRENRRSSFTVYDNLTMDDEIDDFDDEIEKWEEKLQKLEDKYYDQFAAMESAMAKLQSQQSYISSLMGM